MFGILDKVLDLFLLTIFISASRPFHGDGGNKWKKKEKRKQFNTNSFLNRARFSSILLYLTRPRSLKTWFLWQVLYDRSCCGWFRIGVSPSLSLSPSPFLSSIRPTKFFFMRPVSDPFRDYLDACEARFWSWFFFTRKRSRATWNTRERRINISGNGLRPRDLPQRKPHRRNPLLFQQAVYLRLSPLDARTCGRRVNACIAPLWNGGLDRVASENERSPVLSLFFFSPCFRAHLRPVE